MLLSTAPVFAIVLTSILWLTGAHAQTANWEGLWAQNKAQCSCQTYAIDMCAAGKGLPPLRINRKEVVGAEVICEVTQVRNSSNDSFELRAACESDGDKGSAVISGGIRDGSLRLSIKGDIEKHWSQGNHNTFSLKCPTLLPPKERTVGTWRVYELLDEESITTKGVLNAAATKALDGRDAELGIYNCQTHSVGYNVKLGPEFFAALALPEDRFRLPPPQIVFAKIDDEAELWPIMIEFDTRTSFTTHTHKFVRGTNLLLCPKKDETHTACLKFSLRGITAALKLICPKR